MDYCTACSAEATVFSTCAPNSGHLEYEVGKADQDKTSFTFYHEQFNQHDCHLPKVMLPRCSKEPRTSFSSLSSGNFVLSTLMKPPYFEDACQSHRARSDRIDYNKRHWRELKSHEIWSDYNFNEMFEIRYAAKPHSSSHLYSGHWRRETANKSQWQTYNLFWAGGMYFFDLFPILPMLRRISA